MEWLVPCGTMKRGLLAPLTSALLAGVLARQPAQAATGTWNGGAGATWDTSAANWTGVSGTPWDSGNGPGNTALFSSAATPTVSGTVYVNTITMDATTTISGGTITLAGSSPTINGTGAGSIIYSVIAGSGGLIKSGSGTLYLDPGNGSAANTFSGNITVNGGNLISVRPTSLGDGAGAITISSGGILNVDWNTVTRTGLVTVDGSTLRTQGGSPQLINNGAGFVLKNGGAISTSMAGSGGLTVSGTRSYLWSAGNTYTGATVIAAGGDLALQGGGAVPTSTAVELSGNFLVGSGNHTVGGLTGATSTGRLIGGATKTFTVNKVSGTDAYGGTLETMATFIKAGAGALSLTHPNNNSTFPGALTVNNGVLELGGAGRLVAGSYSGAISLASTSSVLRIATSAYQTLSGGISGSGSLVKSGGGTNTLSGSNSYSGGTTVNGGRLIASHANALGDAAGAVTVNSGGTLMVNANMTRTGTVTVNGGDLGTDNSSTLTNNGGGFVLMGSYASAGGVVLAGSSGLTNSSPDARLWAQATYSGATVVNSGQLRICGGGGIPTNSVVAIASGASINLTSFYAPTDINRTIGGLTGAGVLYGGGTGTVTVNKTSGTDTFSGGIQGSQGLIKDGAGTLALDGASTYSGATTVKGGTLQVNAPGSLHAASAVSVQSGGTLGGSGTVKGAVTVNAGGALAPGASVGTLTANSSVTLAGTLRVEVDGNGAGSADRLAVSGTLDITNATVEFDVLAKADDLVYVIASYGTLAGTQFANVADLPAGYRLDYNLHGQKQIALKKRIGTLISVF